MKAKALVAILQHGLNYNPPVLTIESTGSWLLWTDYAYNLSQLCSVWRHDARRCHSCGAVVRRRRPITARHSRWEDTCHSRFIVISPARRADNKQLLSVTLFGPWFSPVLAGSGAPVDFVPRGPSYRGFWRCFRYQTPPPPKHSPRVRTPIILRV